MPDPVVIVDYDPAWPRQFEALRERAAEALGGLVLAIDHIGSTAVPGCAAKPIIDLDVVVRSRADVPAAISRLESLGYDHRGDLGIPDREAFMWPEGESKHHLYLVVSGCEAHRNHLELRDHLRAHPDDARAYGEHKKELAQQYGRDRDGYTEAKSDFISRLLSR